MSSGSDIGTVQSSNHLTWSNIPTIPIYIIKKTELCQLVLCEMLLPQEGLYALRATLIKLLNWHLEVCLIDLATIQIPLLQLESIQVIQ